MFALSWKQKFWLLITITLTGLVLISASGFWGLSKVSSSYEERYKAKGYASDAQQLSNQWMHLVNQATALTSDNMADYQSRLNSLKDTAVALASHASDLNDQAVARQASDIASSVSDYADLRSQWLSTRQQLGMTPFEGQRKALDQAAGGLQQMSLSIIKPYIDEAVSNQRDYISTMSPAYAEKVEKALNDLHDQIKKLSWEDTKIGEGYNAYKSAFDQADTTIKAIVVLEEQLTARGDKLLADIEQQNNDLEQGIINRTSTQAVNARQSAYWQMGIISAVVGLIILLALSQISRTLVRQLNNVITQLSEVAAGNLTANLKLSSNNRDEFTQLGSASNRMTQDIAGVIRQVIDGNEELMRLHDHLSHAMQQLAENSQQVEAQTEQAASATQQISATVNEVAQRTSDVSQATQQATQSARSGSEVIVSSVDSMRQLSQLIQHTNQQVGLLGQSSGKVIGIVDVINSLADQTNLLALNAAIEAARAGEAGRGFSVVADEVRSLAQKTMDATSNIDSIIKEFNSQTKEMARLMENGLTLAAEGEQNAGQVAQAIGDITRSIETLATEMDQVVVAVEEISATTEDIAGKMEHIHIHTSETKTLRTNLDEHTRNLERQASTMQATSQRFRLA
ncbi:methyl-accepting chemotaxis protein [Pokkaliibacter sp. MBI-7]|uniref:methyl-accepting chemotaxis protein n=1 Tax=Pokkaliibacter sp. MBI-7 TaxID=3040600 RepID=UPI0024490D8F|nr:methyl-accepting chemotaxis protein [Pokkaliibacter sp. MBI-7]MDH2434475.1 methyl-accepting chemotaxis protein [Pokkaliibacter sp. MBI-7]